MAHRYMLGSTVLSMRSEQAALLQPGKQIGHRTCLDDGFELTDGAADRALEILRAGLRVGAIQQPSVARHDPADALRRHSVLQQPEARIHAGLAGAHHRIAGIRTLYVGQPIQRYAVHVLRNRVSGTMRRRHGGTRMGGVHQFPAHDDLPLIAIQQRLEAMPAAGARAVVAHRKPLNAARRQEALPHHLVEMAQHFRASGQLVHAWFRPVASLVQVLSSREFTP